MNPILYDTTLRDGTQREGLSLSAEDKVRIACRLDALGIGYIEGGWPGSNPKDAEFFRRIAGVPLRQAKIAAFGMTRHAGGDCGGWELSRPGRSQDAGSDARGQELDA